MFTHTIYLAIYYRPFGMIQRNNNEKKNSLNYTENMKAVHLKANNLPNNKILANTKEGWDPLSTSRSFRNTSKCPFPPPGFQWPVNLFRMVVASLKFFHSLCFHFYVFLFCYSIQWTFSKVSSIWILNSNKNFKYFCPTKSTVSIKKEADSGTTVCWEIT